MKFIDLGFRWEDVYGYLTTRHGIQGVSTSAASGSG